GPSVPESLREQLAVGGTLVIPVGVERVQRLLRVRGPTAERYAEEDLGAVLFVPLIGAEGWEDPRGRTPTRAARRRETRDPPSRVEPPASGFEHDASELSAQAPGSAAFRRRPSGAAEVVAGAAEPFDDLRSADLDPLLERIGAARVILLGEASHGTAEFYEMRARITQALIERKRVRIVAVEADWPDAAQIDRYVRGASAAPHPERAFARFPSWMWANRQVLDFIRALRERNAGLPVTEQVGFHGLDLYSMYTSIRAVLAYLDDVDEDAAAVARARYGCLEPWEGDPAAYGAAALRGRFESCTERVVEMLEDLLARQLEYERRDGNRFFDAARNAALVRNAESYYRAVYYGPHRSWNLRDRHMFDTLEALLRHHGEGARAVVWAHNSHLGNAAATSMSARGEINVGELCRDAYGDACYAIGFGTDHGTVAAADDWEAPMRIMDVRPALESSYERLCHDSGVGNFLLPVGERAADAEVRGALMPERLERAIGVVYRPRTERASHYFHAALPRQFDEWIWFDETRAVDALPVETDSDEMPETYPFGL
ncbi:MAG: erythromycin esterase family protein, partial [Gammaproteobacteria bacterium]|nr:erythromycin esterase family protein [Gammaproteobacteria bacterium]